MRQAMMGCGRGRAADWRLGLWGFNTNGDDVEVLCILLTLARVQRQTSLTVVLAVFRNFYVPLYQLPTGCIKRRLSCPLLC